jgi:hypothetical protein
VILTDLMRRWLMEEPAQEPPEVRSLWTGRLDFPMTTHTGVNLGTVEIVATVTDISFVYVGRTLAIVPRRRLRMWLTDERQPFHYQDVALYRNGRDLGISINSGSLIWLPPKVASDFHRYI